MDAGEGGQGFEAVEPADFCGEWIEAVLLAGLQYFEVFDDGVLEGLEKIGGGLVGEGEEVFGEGSVVGALFYNREWVGAIQAVPHLPELGGQQLGEEGAYADVCEIVALAAEGGAAGAVVAVEGVIEGDFHEITEGHGGAGGDEGLEVFFREHYAASQRERGKSRFFEGNRRDGTYDQKPF